MGKLLLLDLDGSLVTGKDRNRTHKDNPRYLKLIQDLGFEVGMCTGRPRFATKKLYDSLGIEPMITMGGAYVTFRGDILVKEPINLDEEIDNLKSTFGNDAYIGALSENCIEHINSKNDDGPKNFPDFIVGRVDIPLQISIIPKPELKNSSIDFVENYKSKSFDMFYWYTDDSIFIEMHKKGISKWSGLLKIMDFSNYKREDVYFLGDGINDVEMMEHLSNTFAPVNSHPKVLKRAKHILKNDSSKPLLKDIYEILVSK